MTWIFIIVVIIVGVLLVLANLFLDKKTNNVVESKLDGFFEKKERFFTNSEKVFWDLLIKINQERYLILSKVRLEDIVKVGKDITWEKKNIKRNYIKSKHIDFVILDKKNNSILAVIELDGKSHGGEKQTKYDLIKNEILNSVKLKLFRIKVGEKFEEKIKGVFNEIEKKEITN